LWALVSYTNWMLRPTSLPFGVRSVEWVRADLPFGNGLVDEIEHLYYSSKAPQKGGPQLKSLPAAGRTAKAPKPAPAQQAASWPPPINPVFAHPLPGEGAWKPTGPPVNGGP